jgi:hypothetical protein
MIELLVWVNRKRWCFLLMKRTGTEIPEAAALQVNMLTDNLNNIGSFFDKIFNLFP